MATNVPSLSSKILTNFDFSYSNPIFTNILEDHLPLIIKSQHSLVMDVDMLTALHYKNNFYGLLTEMKLDYKYHWIIMRCNNILNPLSFTGEMTKLLHPDLNYVDNLFNTWRTTYRSL